MDFSPDSGQHEGQRVQAGRREDATTCFADVFDKVEGEARVQTLKQYRDDE